MSELATQKEKRMAVKSLIQGDAFREAIAQILPDHCTPERMVRIAINALNRVPKLAECTQTSLFQCLMLLSQYGLEPDGRVAHLIPYGKECTVIIDYKGLVELAYRSGYVSNIHADVVRTGDIFEYDMGRVKRHVPHFLRSDADKPEKSGDVYAVYAMVELKSGPTKTEVLSREDVEAVRKRSKAGRSGPWVTDWNEMAKKTAFRRASKWIPLSAEIREAFVNDDDSRPPIKRVRTTDLVIDVEPPKLGDDEGSDDSDAREGVDYRSLLGSAMNVDQLRNVAKLIDSDDSIDPSTKDELLGEANDKISILEESESGVTSA